MHKRTPSGRVLLLVALTQLIAGGMLSTGCLCGPSFGMIGLTVSFAMAAIVCSFGALAVLARKHPRSAVSGAAMLEGVVILLMLLPTFQPPLMAWYAQVVVYGLICVATLLAFSRPHR